MPADLLFEIGCEEVPAKMLARQLADLPGLVETRLAAARLEHKGVRALGTPRRLAVIVKQLADRQPDLSEQVVGPPVSAAFAADGSLTKAGQGFAAKNGVDPSALAKQEVPGKKGQYVVATRNVIGQDTRKLLPELLAQLAAALPWPKSQRWGWGETTFVRPVQWLVALFGGEVLPLSWANLTAGRASRGHRFLSPGPIEIASADRYVEALRAAHVVVDPDARRELVRAELTRLESETQLRVRPDEALLAEVIHLGEYPVGVSGQFDPSYLEVPEEIIVTAMRTHQRYFAMEDASGKLANRFATMMATVVKDPAVVQKGNEYVIAARLADAKFFFAEDKKKSFEAWNAKLDEVVFQAKLGKGANTIGDKIRRITRVVSEVVPLSNDIQLLGSEPETIAKYCKADLASSVVGEFPELQGTMGKHYARVFGFGELVGVGIEEHYWPRGQGDELPTTAAGALVGLVDRMDTLVGCFASGLHPTGSADPLGLRRAAIGCIAIMIDRGPGGTRETHGFPESTAHLFSRSVDSYGDTIRRDHSEFGPAIKSFFRDRLRQILIAEGNSAQNVDAVLAVCERPADARARAKAVAVVSVQARRVFKRIMNLLDDASNKGLAHGLNVNPELFAVTAEHDLWSAFQAAEPILDTSLKNRDYVRFFRVLGDVEPIVSALLAEREKGGVMVIDHAAPELSRNRLAMLARVTKPFVAVIDLRTLGVAS